MKDSDALHTIIKSLTKAEKRNFKMFVRSSQKSINNYTILFDAIDAQKVYDEKKILKKLKIHAFSKQISRTKYLLYDQILKSLYMLYGNRTKSSEINLMLNSVEILYNKKLYKQAYEMLKKAKKITFNFETLGLQQKILDWEIELFPLQKNQEINPSTMKNLCTDYEKITLQLKIENTYRVLHIKARLIYDSFSDGIYSKEKFQKLEKLMNHSLIKNEIRAITFLSKVFHHEIQFLNAQVHSNNQDALQWSTKLFDIWKNAPEKEKVYSTYFKVQFKGYIFSTNILPKGKYNTLIYASPNNH